MRVNQQAAFILHTRPYRESSLLVDIFSKEHGRITLNAKGARRNKIRWRNALQTFQPYWLSWAGKGELPVLTNTEYQNGYLNLDYRSRVCAYYANELLSRALQRKDPHSSLFEAYALLLGGLSESKRRELCLRRFEKALMNGIGYALILDQDAESGKPIQDDIIYRYVRELGPVEANKISSLSARQTTVVSATYTSQWESSLMVPGVVLNSIAKDNYRDDSVMTEAKQFMRAILKPVLGQKPLISRSLFYHSKL